MWLPSESPRRRYPKDCLNVVVVRNAEFAAGLEPVFPVVVLLAPFPLPDPIRPAFDRPEDPSVLLLKLSRVPDDTVQSDRPRADATAAPYQQFVPRLRSRIRHGRRKQTSASPPQIQGVDISKGQGITSSSGSDPFSCSTSVDGRKPSPRGGRGQHRPALEGAKNVRQPVSVGSESGHAESRMRSRSTS